MPRYQSRLGTVIFYRKHLEEEARIAFVRAKGALSAEEDRLCHLMGQLERVLSGFSARQLQGMTAEEVDIYHQFIKRQNNSIDDCKKAIILLAQQAEEKREALMRAVQDKKAIEKVEEIRKEAFIKELDKKEQNLMDEIGGRQHWRPPRRKER